MRLQITSVELFKIARDYYNLPEGTEVQIVDSTDSSDVRDLLRHLKTVQEAFPAWRTTEKIKSMLALRKEFGYGLADCKYIIENPDQAVQNLRAFCRVRP